MPKSFLIFRARKLRSLEREQLRKSTRIRKNVLPYASNNFLSSISIFENTKRRDHSNEKFSIGDNVIKSDIQFHVSEINPRQYSRVNSDVHYQIKGTNSNRIPTISVSDEILKEICRTSFKRQTCANLPRLTTISPNGDSLSEVKDDDGNELQGATRSHQSVSEKEFYKLHGEYETAPFSHQTTHASVSQSVIHSSPNSARDNTPPMFIPTPTGHIKYGSEIRSSINSPHSDITPGEYSFKPHMFYVIPSDKQKDNSGFGGAESTRCSFTPVASNDAHWMSLRYESGKHHLYIPQLYADAGPGLFISDDRRPTTSPSSTNNQYSDHLSLHGTFISRTSLFSPSSDAHYDVNIREKNIQSAVIHSEQICDGSSNNKAQVDKSTTGENLYTRNQGSERLYREDNPSHLKHDHSLNTSPLFQPMCHQQMSPQGFTQPILALAKPIEHASTPISSHNSHGPQTTYENDSRHVSLWRPMGSLGPPFYITDYKDNSPQWAPFRMQESGDVEIRTQKEDTFAQNLCLPANLQTSQTITKQELMPSLNPQLMDHECNRTPDHPLQINDNTHLNRVQTAAENNQPVLNTQSCQNPLLNSESKPETSRKEMPGSGKRRRRTLKSFMIESIIKDDSDNECDKDFTSTEDSKEKTIDLFVRSTSLEKVEISISKSDSVDPLLLKTASEYSNRDQASHDASYLSDVHNKLSIGLKDCTNIINVHSHEADPHNRNKLNAQALRDDKMSMIKEQQNRFYIKHEHSRNQAASQHSAYFDREVTPHSDTQSNVKILPNVFSECSTNPILFRYKDLNDNSDIILSTTDPQHHHHDVVSGISASKNLLPNIFHHMVPTEEHNWSSSINSVHSSVPLSYHSSTSFFGPLISPLYQSAPLPPSAVAGHGYHSCLPVSLKTQQCSDVSINTKESLGYSPRSDAVSVVSSDSRRTSSTGIPSPSLSLCSNSLSPNKFVSHDATVSFPTSTIRRCQKTEKRTRHAEKTERGSFFASKSFKSILENRNVKLEFINSGNGIKNPLFCTDFDDNKLGLLPGNNSLSCPVCKLTFDLARHLQRHLKSHREIKRFLCSFCGKGFNDTFDLKRHTRTHTGVRPYKCSQCDKAFTQRCSLESHCRKIHGLIEQLAFNERRVKLYVCEICGNSTDLADEHYSHVRQYHTQTRVSK